MDSSLPGEINVKDNLLIRGSGSVCALVCVCVALYLHEINIKQDVDGGECADNEKMWFATA